MKLKYYIKNYDSEETTEITSKEYEELILNDAACYHMAKTTALKVIRENRKYARNYRVDKFWLVNGKMAVIEAIK